MATEKKKREKKFIIQVTAEDHKLVKMVATKKGISMTLWIMRAIAKELDNEREVGNI